MSTLAMSPLATTAFDGMLAVLIAWTAWQSVTSREVFRAVVLFVVFGLLLALAWLRLGAPDVALAEAAVGAGLTGVLFLESLGHLRRNKTVEPPETVAQSRLRRWAVGLPVVVAGGLLAVVALRLEPRVPGIAGLVVRHQGETGVSNPVTAVLLDFRSTDTLLEVVVVLLAVIATYGLVPHGPAHHGPRVRPPETPRPPRQPVLVWFVRRLAPLALLVGVYLWWVGSSAPGGAFQAAAVVAAVFALLRVSGMEAAPPPNARPMRLLMVAGSVAFVSQGLAMLAAGRVFLDLPETVAYGLIVSLEGVLAASLAACLIALVAGVPRPPRQSGERP